MLMRNNFSVVFLTFNILMVSACGNPPENSDRSPYGGSGGGTGNYQQPPPAGGATGGSTTGGSGGGATGGTTTGGSTGDSTATIVDGGRINRTLNPNVSVQLGLPATYSGYCNPTNLAVWTIEGSSNGISLQNPNSCAVGVTLNPASWLDNAGVAVLGKLRLDSTRMLEVRYIPSVRKAPVVDFISSNAPSNPAFGFNLNNNMAQFTGGKNYNNDGEKMRFNVAGAAVAFRDYDVSKTRSFTIPIASSDMSPADAVNNIGMSDFSYSVSCFMPNPLPPATASGYAFYTEAQKSACANYCPFTVSQSSSSSVTIEFVGTVVNNIFKITNPNSCWKDSTSNYTPISFKLNVTSGGGTTSKTIAYLKTEAD